MPEYLFEQSLISSEIQNSLPINYKLRPLAKNDFEKGVIECLGQLSVIGSPSKEQFIGYYIIVIENEEEKIVGVGTLLVELKFLRSCGKVGHIEDIVVHDSQRGKSLGKSEKPRAYSGDRCRKIEEKGLEACEDIVIHHESGYAFMACGNSELRRTHWYPPSGVFKNQSIQYREQVFVYKIDSELLLPLSFKNYPDNEDVVLHGLGIYQDPAHRNILYIFLINHKRSGSVIEIFNHRIGSQELQHLETIKNDLIHSPNNLLPVSKNEFYVTNDLYYRKGFKKEIELADKISYPNGINGNWDNSRIYLGTSTGGKLFIYERKHDNKLKLLDTVKTDATDNVSVDDITGEIYLATFPKLIPVVMFLKDYGETHVPSAIVKISNNTNEDKFYGVKYSKEIVYQDDGSFFNHITVAAVDRKRNVMLLGSFISKGIVRCELEYELAK
nr:6544_t:CDS:2 [Entrophospora candida]